MNKNTRRAITWLTTILLAATLAACGGGTANGECTVLDPGRNSSLPNCPASAAAETTAAAAVPTIKLSLADAAGATTTTVTAQRAGVVQALLKDAGGNPVSGVAVIFSTSDKTASLAPASGSDLTDSAGIARIGVAAGTQAGGFTVTANATVRGTNVTANIGFSVSFPTLSLSPLTIGPSPLGAGGTASLTTTVMDGAQPFLPAQSVSFTSPCAAAGKATISSPVTTVAGVASTSYIDKGCGAPDTITASTSIGGAAVSQTGNLTVLLAAAGSIKFISADTTNIALKGTGGFGRQEFATLTFKVYDKTGAPVAGTLVDMAFADANPALAVGGLTLFPSSATSGVDGTVTTLVRAGTIPTSVRVLASILGSTVTTLSNILVISTGVPDQKHFSLSTSVGNCEGRDFDRLCSIVTARLADHFGNPVPDGTAVNFTAEGGSIGASCVTGSLPPPGATPVGQTTNSSVGPGSGACSVELYASKPRPENERVTILAYALGEEDFFDANGNNVFDQGEPFTDKSPDIFRDDIESKTWTPGEPCIGPNSNGLCSSAGDGRYNGALSTDRLIAPPTTYVSAQLVQIFSGSSANIQFRPSSVVCTSGGTTDVEVTVTDKSGKIMPAGTTIDFAPLFLTEAPPRPSSGKVPNIVLAVGQVLEIPTYTVTLSCGSGKLFVTVTTPQTQTTTIASIPIN